MWAYHDYLNLFNKDKATLVSSFVANENLSAEEVIEHVAALRIENEKKKDEAFYKDLAKYVPVETKYASGALMAAGWVMMAVFKYKKY